MKKLILSAMLLLSAASWAELPSWGMTENQYKLPNFSNKMGEVGAQAYKNNWLLKVTAPSDWHSTIRDAMTKTGERDVQVSFKDSVYQSISISAVPGAKTAKISPSTSNGAIVQKQVVIDKPEIDTAIEAPDFGDTDFKNNTSELLESLSAMEMTVPTVQVKTPPRRQRVKNVAVQPKVAQQSTVVQTEQVTAQAEEAVKSAPKKAVVVAPPTQAQPEPVVVPTVADVKDSVEALKEELRKRHARTKRVHKLLKYSNINSKDELFINGPVVLIKRFINQGVVLFFWMNESYDPTVHKLVEKGSGKYKKDPTAIAGATPGKEQVEEQKIAKEIMATNLDFVAVDSAEEDQDDLRGDFIRNKRVDYSISADRLKQGDILYVQNQTVLVERPLTSSRSAYFWLVGDTTINSEVERKSDNRFVIK